MIRCGEVVIPPLFLCLKSVFFDAGYSGGYSKWIFTFIELDIQNRVLAVCDTDMLKYHNFKNTPCFLFDSPPLKTILILKYISKKPLRKPVASIWGCSGRGKWYIAELRGGER